MKAPLSALLRRHGCRLTGPRRRILEYLARGGAHGSAESVHRALKREGASLGRATVFRTLKLFARIGLAEAMLPPLARRRFEATGGKPHHDHMTCLGCGAVIEFSNGAIERLQRAEARRRGFSIAGHCLEVTGYCRRCQGRGRAA